MESSYTLDDRDVVVACGGDWDRFARENQAEGAQARCVIGKPLRSFLADDDTAAYLEDIFQWVRGTATPFRTVYRCDAPDIARQFRMVVEPDDGGLRVSHRLLWERPLATLSDHHDGLIERLGLVRDDRCSVCCAFRVGDQWVDALACPDRQLFPASYRVCDACRTKMRHLTRKGQGAARAGCAGGDYSAATLDGSASSTMSNMMRFSSKSLGV